jgi:hypothetical protein
MEMFSSQEVTMDDEPEDEDVDETLTWEVPMSEVYSAKGTGASAGTPAPGSISAIGRENPNSRLHYEASGVTMSSKAIPLPPDVDYAGEMSEARWQHLKACVRQDDVWEAFKAHLDLISNAPRNPLARTFTELCELPPQDAYELAGIVQGMRLREKVALADAVLDAMGNAWLSVATAVENRPF